MLTQKEIARRRVAGAKCIQKIRAEVINKHGGKCSVCGEKDPIVLQIDHVNGNGAADRRKYRSAWKFYKHVLQDNTGKYQVLCANDNQRKRWNNKEFSKKGE